MRKVGQANIIPIPYEDREKWLGFRSSGIGGSEAASILGLDDYSNPAKVFHQKIGVLQFPDIDNEAMFWGREIEDVIAHKWMSWWDGEYIDNYKRGIKIRNCQKVNGYAVNPEFPQLFGSLDRYIPKGKMGIDGEIIDGGVLEIKTISEYESSKWTYGIPEKYVIQVHVYMMVFGFRYAEIVYLMGGNKMRVVPIPYNQELADTINYNTAKFWVDRVMPAKELVKQYRHHLSKGDKTTAQSILWEIDRYEPGASGNKSYRELMNNKYDNYTFDYHPADEEALLLAIKHKKVKEMIKHLGSEALALENQLVHIHDLNKAEYVRFGDEGGYSRFYMKKNGVNPTFDNRIKVEVVEADLKELTEKLLQNEE